MKQTLHVVALRTVRHNERHNIFTGYSLESGRVAMAVTAGAGKSASRLRALLMPLSIIECEADMRPGRDIHTMSGVRAVVALHGIHAHPMKSAVAMFLAELLSGLLREGPPDTVLWHFVADSITVLDSLEAQRIANFHLCFLYGLGRCLGVAPDVEGYERGRVFDMRDGCFRLSPPLHPQFLASDEAPGVWVASRLTYRNMHRWRLTRVQRQRALDAALSYLSLHYASLASLKSLDVLRALI